MLKTYLFVMLGGALGVAARMLLTTIVTFQFGDRFPWGTLLVNLGGCFLIGLLARWDFPTDSILSSPLMRQVSMVGVLGGFTTFSAFSLQVLDLVSKNEVFAAIGYVILSVSLCLFGTWCGMALAGIFSNQ